MAAGLRDRYRIHTSELADDNRRAKIGLVDMAAISLRCLNASEENLPVLRVIPNKPLLHLQVWCSQGAGWHTVL